MPSSPNVKKAFLKALPKNLEGIVSELGSGWGTLAFALSCSLPSCRIEAYENSSVPYFFSKLRLLLFQRKNLFFSRENFFQVPLNDAKLVTCYLYPSAMERLRKKLEQELSQESFVICHTFAIPSWHAEKVIEVQDLYRTKIYYYSMKSIKQKTLGMG